MPGGYVTPSGDQMGELFAVIRQMKRDIAEIGRPSGTQTAQALQQIRDLINGILEQTEVNVSGSVTAGGNITSTGGIVQANAGLWSTSVYNDTLAGLWHSTYAGSDGKLGYVPSSRRFKQDEQTAVIPDIRDIMRKFRVCTFRYIAAVEARGDDAPVEWGPMAEDLHDLGLFWLVDYDEKGDPLGIKHERVAYLLALDAQDKQSQLDDLERRVQALER